MAIALLKKENAFAKDFLIKTVEPFTIGVKNLTQKLLQIPKSCKSCFRQSPSPDNLQMQTRILTLCFTFFY